MVQLMKTINSIFMKIYNLRDYFSDTLITLKEIN